MITEDQLEQLAIQWFEDTGWTHVNGAVLAPEGVAAERDDFRAVVLKGRLAEAVRRLNPKLPESAVEEVVHVVTKPEHPSLVQSNSRMTGRRDEKSDRDASAFGPIVYRIVGRSNLTEIALSPATR